MSCQKRKFLSIGNRASQVCSQGKICVFQISGAFSIAFRCIFLYILGFYISNAYISGFKTGKPLNMPLQTMGVLGVLIMGSKPSPK